jgi:hypothetical protein
VSLFWRLQIGIGAAGMAALAAVGTGTSGCTSAVPAADTCTALDKEILTATDTSLETSFAACLQVGTDPKPCVPGPVATALLAALPAEANTIDSIELASQGNGSGPCSYVPTSATITDATQARAVFAALLAGASPGVVPVPGTDNVCFGDSTDDSCETIAPTITLDFRTSSSKLVVEVVLFNSGGVNGPSAEFAQGGGFYVGEGLNAALQTALGIAGSSSSVSCCLY